MSNFLAELLQEINKVRSNPSSYADKVDSMKAYFDKKILRMPGSKVGFQTQEGAAAYDECAKFLKGAESSDQLRPSKGLTKIADELLVVVQKDPSQIGTVDMNELIDKYGSFVGSFNRIMECGGSTPEQVVINLLVSDGEKSRNQRNVLLSKGLKTVGLASGNHDIYKTATIIVMCTKFENKTDADDFETYGGNVPKANDSEGKGQAPSQPKPQPQPQPQPQSQPKPTGGLTMLNEKIIEQPKPVIKEPPKETKIDDENVVSVDRAERVVVDGGKRKKKITLTKHYKDGHTEKEVKFENL